MSKTTDRPLSDNDEAVINSIHAYDLGHDTPNAEGEAAMKLVAPELLAAWNAFSAAKSHFDRELEAARDRYDCGYC
jgi:hypothetical protein